MESLFSLNIRTPKRTEIGKAKLQRHQLCPELSAATASGAGRQAEPSSPSGSGRASGRVREDRQQPRWGRTGRQVWEDRHQAGWRQTVGVSQQGPESSVKDPSAQAGEEVTRRRASKRMQGELVQV